MIVCGARDLIKTFLLLDKARRERQSDSWQED
jgi:hypothetical protein